MASTTATPTGLLRAAAEAGALGTWSDADLLARFAATRGAPDDGGDLAFEVLVRRHGAMVRGVCRRALLDPVDADDAFQATFLILVRRAGAVRVGDSLAPWLFGVARRVARRARLDRDRRQRREGTATSNPEPASPEATDPHLAEVLAVLDAEVARLPEPFRSALVLCDLGGRTIDEASRELGSPPGTIKSRLHRARDRLRSRLARRGFGGPGVNPASLAGRTPPPDRLVAALLGASNRPGPNLSRISWPFFVTGARRMTALIPIRWAAAASLSAAAGLLGAATLGQKPNVVPGQSEPVQTPQHLPTESQKVAMQEYVVEPPDIIKVEVLEALAGRPIAGEFLVRPDGKISLGFYGELYVAGLSVTEIKAKVIVHLQAYLTDAALGLRTIDAKTGQDKPVKPANSDRVFVDVASFNSKVYYVEGAVATPGRLPITGNETVLDAIHFAGSLLFFDLGRAEVTLIRPESASKTGPSQKFPVDLKAIVQGDTRTNYQLMPGDRVVVARNPPLTDEEWGNTRLLQKVQDQGTRLDALEKKLDRILEKLSPPTPAPTPPAAK